MAKQKSSGSGDDILLNISVDGRNELTGAYDDATKLKDGLKQVGGSDISKPATSLKTQLREATLEAQKLFAAGKQNTKEYAEAAKKVTALKNDMDELNNTFKAFDPDNKFRVFANTASAGARAIQGYAGAMAFLGVESEDATKTIARLQGIMAFADAIDSLGDLNDSYKDLLRLLGLTSKAQESAVAVTETAVTAEITAEERLAAARLQVSETSIAAKKAYQAAQLSGLSATEATTEAERAFLEASKANQVAVQKLKSLQSEATTGTEVATAATTGLSTAQKSAAVASNTLGIALKSIGIGLIISALVYLVTNFEKVKAVFTDLFPSLKEGAGLWDSFKQSVFGVGNAVLQFVVAPIKTVVDLIRGDFKAALNDLKQGVSFAANYNAGAAKEAAAQNDERRRDRISSEIEANERIIKERKALGQSTTAIEIETQRKRIEVLDRSDKDYVKNRQAAETELTVLINTETKRRNDLAAAALKVDLDQIKANQAEALKVVKAGAKNMRAAELSEIETRYNKEVELLNKRKLAVKDFNKAFSLLTEARGVEEQSINKKYGDAIQAYKDEAAQQYFTEYEKREAEIKKRAAELLKTATPTEAGIIQQNEAFFLAGNTKQSIASDANDKAQKDLTYSEIDNRPNERDTPDEARQKIEALANARFDAEQAAYELKKAQLEGHYNELAQLEADHEKTLTEINDEEAEARKQIAAAETENRLRMFDAVAAGASAASELVGESTLASKALSIASASINTYAAIAGQLAAFSKVPIPGYAIAQAIATGLVGLAQVKKIMTVNVPGKGGSSSPSAGLAPIINSTVLTQQSNGTSNVVQAVNDQKSESQPIRAFIVNKDLDEQRSQKEYYDSQSTY